MIRNLLAVSAVLLLVTPVIADWPQWGGPNRDFKVADAGLTSTWPASGPKKLWSRELGDGYGCIVEDNGTLYVMYRKKKPDSAKGEGRDVVAALSAKTGKPVWEYEYPANTLKDQVLDFGEGPNSTPLIRDQHLYTISFSGILNCLDRRKGSLVWSKNLIREFDGKVQEFGYAASPIIYDGKLIVLVGGKKGGVVAFNPNSGTTAWASGEFDISYASPIVINVDGEDQIVFMSSGEVIGISPVDGSLKWRHPHLNQYKNNCFAPLFGRDNLLFVSSHTDGGTRVLHLRREDGRTNVKELWADKGIRIFHSTAVRIGDLIYGTIGDNAPTFIAAVDVKDGEVKWKERGFPKANIVYVEGGKVVILDENGQLALAEVSPKGMKVLGKTQILEKVAWSAPTLVGTTAFIRDRKQIVALDLSPPRP